MCSRVTCPDCSKPTFRGCGMHVEQVLGNVPKNERCQCREQAKARNAEEQPAERKGFWSFWR